MRSRILTAVIVLVGVAAVYGLFLYSQRYEKRAQTILDRCGTNVGCISTALTDILMEKDTGAAFNILREMYSLSADIPPSCFAISSNIGMKTAARQSDFTQLSLRPESIFCNYGFYQSYSRERLLATKDATAAADFCVYVAEKLGGVSSDASVECYRGMGHALPFIRSELNGDVSAMSLFAVESCERLIPAGRGQDACFSGVFSRLGSAERNEWWGISVAAQDPLKLCREVDEKYRPYCFGNYKRALMDGESEPQSLVATLSVLEAQYPALSAEDVSALAFTVGYDKAKMQAAHLDYEELIKACLSDDLGLQNQCISGLAVGIAKNGRPGSQDTQVLALCRSVKDVDASVCPSEGALEYLKGFFPSHKFRSICREFKVDQGVCAQ